MEQWIEALFERIEGKLSAESDRMGDRIPYWTESGRYREDYGQKDISWWTNGFWCGILWQLYHAGCGEKYRRQAEAVAHRAQSQKGVEERSVLQLQCDCPQLMRRPYALNEIAVLKHDSSSMITIHAYINGAPLATYQADGLIVATPTGSTAYSLSVGGPVVVPYCHTMAITAVAPHSLNMRPIVICDDWEVRLEVESRSGNFLVSIDGCSESCPEGMSLLIRRASHTVKVVKRAGHVPFGTLRSKMMWGADVR